MKNWREYEVSYDKADEMIEEGATLYAVFEEDPEGTKTYDLCKGVFTDLAVAKDYASRIAGSDEIHVADYAAYMEGNYDYL